ncbi:MULTISPECIES: FAD-binding oxidoreductase [unclassified Anaerobiospirillum]|uniref:FAD-binding oxidoreductase n=1 Tax=unclassified Anaerobiospirillum TaxID=2647410 RepID=UPI001FF1DCC3|nr:FAD-binding oxidoreductase [Anaerobiospirillum sp. NML120511]MCK0540190.1 FAD-binding oxidoreductase [Anaerobiospirillum sp. NML02-A-032]
MSDNTICLQLKKLLSSEAQVQPGDAVDTRLLTDFLGYEKGHAEVYVKAACAEDVRAAVAFACEHRMSVTVRAAGTNLVGSTIPQGGLVLDVSGMNRILELDEENRTITVEPGVLLCDLQAYVEERGLFYPPDPAEKHATVGGNIATNAGGMRAVKYGVTRDYVLGLEVVTPDGRLVDLGSKCLKDSTGLNLKQLFIGSEGTLGVITRCVLRLIDKPESTCHALVGFKSLREAITSVNEIKQALLEPTAIEFIERKVIALGEQFTGKSFPMPECSAYLVVTFDGRVGEPDHRLQRCREVLEPFHNIEFLPLTDPAISSDVWTVRSALAKAVQTSGLWEPVDTVVPLSDIATFVDYVSELSEKSGIRILAFGHAGDGNVHLCILKDDLPVEKWPDTLTYILSSLYRRVYELKGKVAAEHGLGRHKRNYFLKEVDPQELALMRAVKAAFDPHNLFNPHSGYSL